MPRFLSFLAQKMGIICWNGPRIKKRTWPICITAAGRPHYSNYTYITF